MGNRPSVETLRIQLSQDFSRRIKKEIFKLAGFKGTTRPDSTGATSTTGLDQVRLPRHDESNLQEATGQDLKIQKAIRLSDQVHPTPELAIDLETNLGRPLDRSNQVLPTTELAIDLETSLGQPLDRSNRVLQMPELTISLEITLGQPLDRTDQAHPTLKLTIHPETTLGQTQFPLPVKTPLAGTTFKIIHFPSRHRPSPGLVSREDPGTGAMRAGLVLSAETPRQMDDQAKADLLDPDLEPSFRPIRA